MDETKHVDTQGAADILTCSPAFVLYLRKNGDLPEAGFIVRSGYYFERARVEEFAKEYLASRGKWGRRARENKEKRRQLRGQLARVA